MPVADNLALIREQIRQACLEAGRDPQQVHLLAVSKTRGIEDIRDAVSAGQHHFGENYLQEALAKANAFPGESWHFIGAIQSNKTRDIAKHFDWVHSVASLKVARRLSAQRDPLMPPINLLIQVNQSAEATKSGVDPADTLSLVDGLSGLPGITPRGLMTIPEPDAGVDFTRERFCALRELRDEIAGSLNLEQFDQLSMGMSSDFVQAIREGATWVRIGTAVFGPRPT